MAGVSLCALMIATPAAAQDVPVTENQPASAETGAQASDAEQPTAPDIVVTGSRIIRSGFNSPTPTLINTADQLQAAAPDGLTQGLAKLPIFNASGGATGSNGGRTLGSGGINQTGNFLNLRNFGTIRTLILLDGRRMPATNFDGNVDVDTLPQALVQRVDVVTGGASAVYGSDAVTGVVNYVLDHKFSGVKGVIQNGISEYGDDHKFRTNIAVGTSLFGGRGHFIASAEYSKTDGVATKESRPWFKNQLIVGAGTAANPYRIIDNGVNNNASFGGKITAGPAALVGMNFNSNGTVSPFNLGVPGSAASGTNSISSGGDGAYHINTSLAARLETVQGFGRFEYELAPSVTAFAQFNYSHQEAAHTQVGGINRQAGAANAITIFKDNAFLRPEVNALIPAGGSITVSQFGFYGIPLFDIFTSSKVATAGLEGKLGGDWRWDATYTHGEGRTQQRQKGNSNNSHFYAALDAVRDPASGNIVCRVSLTPSASLYPGCVPINVLGVGNWSDAAHAYTTNETGWTATNTVDDFSANLSGTLFNNWAGPVSIAAGFEYRKQKLVQTTTDDPNTPIEKTGLRGVPASALTYAGVLVAASRGQNEVYEFNAETLIPLLRDVPFARNLEFSGAVRYTHYSNSGGVTTYKLGGTWQPINDLRFRVVRSRDIRAPTLYDLYAGTSVRVLGFTDPLTNTFSSAQNISRGNPNLVPEVSNTFSGGAVLSPSWLPGFQLSVDYFQIKMDNAIGAVDTTTAINQCTASGGTSPLCQNFVRPISNTDTSPANFPTIAYTQSVNIAQIYTSGIDVEMSYSTRLTNLWDQLGGTLGLRFVGTYQPELKSQAYPGAGYVNSAGQLATQNGIVGLAKLRFAVIGTYQDGPFSLNMQNNWTANQKWDAVATKVYNLPEVGAYSTTDLRIGYTVKNPGSVEMFVAVNNLFNRWPRIFPPMANPGQSTPIVPGDDTIGRFFTAGVRFKF
jgi:outer membrane receptor protein involved in Fe transport